MTTALTAKTKPRCPPSLEEATAPVTDQPTHNLPPPKKSQNSCNKSFRLLSHSQPPPQSSIQSNITQIKKKKIITPDTLKLSHSVTECFKILTQAKFIQLRPIEGRSQCAGPSVRDLVSACRKRAERGMAQEGATEGRSHTHTHTGTERQLPKKVSVCKGRDARTPHIRSRERLTEAQRR